MPQATLETLGHPERQRAKDGTMRGRRTLLTRKKIEIVAKAIRIGMSKTRIGALVGVTRDCLTDWLNRGVRDHNAGVNSVYTHFFRAVARAEAEFELECIAKIREAGQLPQYWTARSWLLERKFPDDYARTEKVELSGREGQPIDIRTLPPEQLGNRITVLMERLQNRLKHLETHANRPAIPAAFTVDTESPSGNGSDGGNGQP